MFTYTLMGMPFLVLVLLLDTVILKTWIIKRTTTWIIMAHMLVLTAIFDQLLVHYIVNYNEAHTLGVRIWLAPIEDFSYTIAAVIGIGALLHMDKRQSETHQSVPTTDKLHKAIRKLASSIRHGVGFREALVVSRPFWWINTTMPFVVSYFIIGHRHDLALYLGILYFSFAYNFFMYGINDIFDYESDIRNPRKTGIDGSVMAKTKHTSVWFWVLLTNIPLTIYFYLQGDVATNLWFTLMIFMVIAYSVAKLRFKERPVIDSFTSSFHYTSPFIFGGLLAGNSNLYIGGFITFFVWVMSNHAFGAIQDITPDREANIKSIATELGASVTTILVFIGYCIAAALPVFLYGTVGILGSLVLLVYVYFVGQTLPYRHNDQAPIFHTTWKQFLYANYAAGFVITFALLLGFRPFGLSGF